MRNLFMIPVLVVLVSFGLIGGCNSKDSDKSRVEGLVLSVNGDSINLADISVIAINSNDKRVSSKGRTNALGEFSIGINNEGGSPVRLVTLVFTTPSLDVFTRDFLIPRKSTSLLDVSLSGGNVNIAEGDYTVLSKRISINDNKVYSFANLLPDVDTPGLAEFVIDGKSNTCLRARDNSSVIIEVADFSALNCDIGIRTGTNALVDISSSGDFEVLSRSFGVRAANFSEVFLSATDDFFIESSKSFGIGAINASTVDVNDGIAAPASCTIFGNLGNIEVLDLADVTVPANCL